MGLYENVNLCSQLYARESGAVYELEQVEDNSVEKRS